MAAIDPQPVTAIQEARPKRQHSLDSVTSLPQAAPAHKDALLARPAVLKAMEDARTKRKHSADSVVSATPAASSPTKTALLSLTYGFINSVMCIPVLYGYAAIIFSHPVYYEFMPALSKLVLLSSAVHQVTFSSRSTLPFAIGQVQDAGLIFLSKMTFSIAELLEGEDPRTVVATALATTAISTLTLGVCMVIAGKLELARFVSYLPTPVIGGYLAYIGYFCLEAGLSLCTGKNISGVASWGQLLNTRDILLCTPGIVFGGLLSWVSRRFSRQAYVLPGCLMAIPTLFYICLGMSGHNLQDARDQGLVGPLEKAAAFYQVFNLYDLKLVAWWALPHQFVRWLGMVIVVAFSSTLDVAAIEMDMGRPLEANRELQTVGWSNVVSGATGGFTGSYIFSQTIFTYRTRCWSRAVGWIVTFSELAVFFLHADPLMFVPLSFFAATLTWIAWELMIEWLWEVRLKMFGWDIIILFATFCAIQAAGLNLGLLCGLVLSLMHFAVSYASETMHTMQRVHKRSRVMRPPSQRRVLQVHKDKIICMELRGELFFGSSTQVLEEVRGILKLTGGPNSNGPANGTSDFLPGGAKRAQPSVFQAAATCSGGIVARIRHFFGGKVPGGAAVDGQSRANTPLLGARPSRIRKQSYTESPRRTTGTGGSPYPGRHTSVRHQGGAVPSPNGINGNLPRRSMRMSRAASASQSPGMRRETALPGNLNQKEIPSYIIFDCSRLSKIDVSAARTCFAPLQQISEKEAVCIAYAGLTRTMQSLLMAHKALDGEWIHQFPTVYAALDWCETSIITAADVQNTNSKGSLWTHNHYNKDQTFVSGGLTMSILLCDYLELAEGDPLLEDLSHLDVYCTEWETDAGQVVFKPGDPGDRFFVVLEGSIALEASALIANVTQLRRKRSVATTEQPPNAEHRAGERGGLELHLEAGALVGYVDYYLEQQERTFTATSEIPSILCVFTHEGLVRMLQERPRLLALLELCVLKHSSQELTNCPV